MIWRTIISRATAGLHIKKSSGRPPSLEIGIGRGPSISAVFCRLQSPKKTRGIHSWIILSWATTLLKMDPPSAPLAVPHDGGLKAPSKKKPRKPTVPTKMEKEADLVMGVSHCD